MSLEWGFQQNGVRQGSKKATSLYILHTIYYYFLFINI